MIPTDQIILGDAIETMRALPDGCVDALISDPPYGTTALSWDKAPNLEEFWKEAHRVCKETAVMVMFSAQPFTTDLINSNRKFFRYEIIWQKTMPVGFLDSNKRPLRSHENIEVFCRKYRGKGNARLSTYNPQKTEGKPRTSTRRSQHKNAHYGKQKATEIVTINEGWCHPRSVQTFSNGNHKSPHPTAKPIPLMEWLVKTYSNPGDLVLDPYFGSGSTGVAAALNDRNYIGIELSPEYHATATQRIAVAKESVA